MKLLVFGSKDVGYLEIAPYIPKETTLIIRGDEGVIEACAEEYADKNRISKLVLRPDYKHYGKFARFRRNNDMVKLCDAVLVIKNESSHDTNAIINRAEKASKKIILVIRTKGTKALGSSNVPWGAVLHEF